jgi:hypothetical protein
MSSDAFHRKCPLCGGEMLRSRSNTSGYTSYFWKKPWKTGLFSWGVEKVFPWACMGCGVVLFYLDRLPAVAEEYRLASQPRAGGLPGDDQALIAIRYLDGNRLSRAVIAGAHFVAERAEALNKINVFPVPDGDTGTNVASTLQKVAAGISRLRQRHIREMSKALATRRSAVRGDRARSWRSSSAASRAA